MCGLISLRRFAPGLICAAAVTACALGDLLSGPQERAVVVTYVGDTTLDVGDTIPVAVTVLVDGDTLPNPRLSVTSDNTSVVAVLAGGDSVTALARGTARLTIRFVSAILTESVPTTGVDLCVNVPLPNCPLVP
jgi:hypothetical protein